MSDPILRYFVDPAAAAAGVVFCAPRGGDAGFDIRAAREVCIAPGGAETIPTGLRVAIPSGWVGFIKDRSSMAARRIYSHGGVIDASYRGEIRLLLSNHGDAPVVLAAGERIAQMVILPCVTRAAAVASVDALGETERGEDGFGSTGRV